MPQESLTVLGGGNTAFAVAANLTLAGASVTLCELTSFESMIRPIQSSREIELGGVAHRGTARLVGATTDFSEALSDNELVLLIVPAYGHQAFAQACAPHLRSGQTVVLMPGTLGSLEFARILKEQGSPGGVIIAETDTAPYVCRKLSPNSAHIWGMVEGMGLGVWPAGESERVRKLVDRWFPGVRLYEHVVACGLGAMNPVVHPAGVLLNAGRIEYSRGEFYFYEEGVTPGICNLINQVDNERRLVGKALGVQLSKVNEAFQAAGFGPKGDLWATINGSRMLTQLRAPGALETRWLTEDVPYGLATWVALGHQFEVSCPTMRSIVNLASATLKTDFWQSARTLEQLGIAGMDRQSLLDYLNGTADIQSG